MSDAILNVPFSSLRNKTRVIINNTGGGVAGALANVSVRGKNDSWSWVGIIKDDRPNASRTNQQWVVVRNFYFENGVAVVNNAGNNYETCYPEWRTAGNAYDPLNVPALFTITCDTNLGGSVQTSQPTHASGVEHVGEPTRDTKIMGMCPYATPSARMITLGTDGNSDTPFEAPCNVIGGQVHKSWEEGVLMSNVYNRQIGFEIMDQSGVPLVLRTQNSNQDNRSSDTMVGVFGVGVLVNWQIELDIYDVMPRDERQQAIH